MKKTVPGNFMSGINGFCLLQAQLGKVQGRLARKGTAILVAKQAGTDIEGAFQSPFPENLCQTPVLHHTIVIAQSKGLAFPAGEYQGIKSLAH